MDMSTCIRAHMFTRNHMPTRPAMFIPMSMDITAGLIVIAGGIEETTHIASIANTGEIETATDANK